MGTNETVEKVWRETISPIFCSSLYKVFGVHKIESPIEQIMYITLVTTYHHYKLRMKEVDDLVIKPQFKLGKYRIDFKVSLSNRDLLIECDSQEWHERTEKQRRYEKERDRFIQSKGYCIFHYTGKEIIDNPMLIALEIIDYLSVMSYEKALINSKDGYIEK